MSDTIHAAAATASLHIMAGLLRDRLNLLPQLFVHLGEDFYTKLPDDDSLIAQQILSQSTFDSVALATALGDKRMARVRQTQAELYRPSNGDIAKWCEEVKTYYLQQRQSLLFRDNLAALSKGADPQAVLSASLQNLGDLTHLQNGRLLVDKGDKGLQLVKHWQDVAAGKHVGKLSTGLNAVDTALNGGLPTGNKVILFVGIPASGKTALAAQVAWETAYKAKDSVTVFFSAEASAEEIIEREAARRARINLDVLESGAHDYDQERLSIFYEWIEYLSAMKTMQICELAGLKASQLKQIVMQAKLKANADKVDLIVLDHIQLFKPDERTDNKASQIDQTYFDIQASLKEFACPKIFIAHQNKASQERSDPRPNSADIAYAGDKQADLILFFLLPKQFVGTMSEDMLTHFGIGKPLIPADYEKAFLYVTKQRRGKGYAEIGGLSFEGQYYHWSDSVKVDLK